jgi:hypothetical protein
VPGSGDPAPPSRLAPLLASEKDSGASVSVNVGQRIRLAPSVSRHLGFLTGEPLDVGGGCARSADPVTSANVEA